MHFDTETRWTILTISNQLDILGLAMVHCVSFLDKCYYHHSNPKFKSIYLV